MNLIQRKAFLFLSLLGLIAYLNSFHGVFIFDDNRWLLAFKEGVLSFSTWNFFLPARPVTMATLALNYVLGGTVPWSYHLVNIGIHLGCACLIFELLRQTFQIQDQSHSIQKKSFELAFVIAALWVVHPLNTSVVTWILRRDESLAAFFTLLTLYFNLRAAEDRRRHYSRRWEIFSVASCFLAMGCKQTAMATPFLVFLYDGLFLYRKKSWIEIFRKKTGYYTWLSLSLLFLAYLNLSVAPVSNQGAGHGVTCLDYFLTQAGVILYYIKLTFWPYPLDIDYFDWPITHSLLEAAPNLAILSTLFFLTLAGIRKRQPLAFAGAWFFLILAPTSSFIPIVGDAVGERRMYLPLVVVITLVVFGLYFLLQRIEMRWPAFAKQKKFLVLVLFLTIGIALIVTTVKRNDDYKSAAIFFKEAIKHRPRNPRNYYGYAFLQYQQRRVTAETMKLIDQGLALNPNFGPGYLVQGYIFYDSNRLDDAMKSFQNALEKTPPVMDSYLGSGWKAHFGLGKVFEKKGDYKNALIHFDEAQTKNIEDPLICGSRGLLLFKMKRYDEASASLQKAVELGSRDPEVLDRLNQLKKNVR